MEKAFNVSDVRFENENLVIIVDNQLVTLELSDILEKLANATEHERRDFKISPSGYGIHWRLLDEALSINGLLKQFEAKRAMHQA